MKLYATAEAMRYNSPPYGDPFILQWEIPNPKDGQERKYVVFDGIQEYLRYFSQGRYTTCHEVFLNSNYDSKAEVAGHPAFDLDIKFHDKNGNAVNLSPTWQQDLQDDILKVLSMQYNPISDIAQQEWVWISSENPSKISKHLVLRFIVFSMWKTQMKILTDTLCTMEDRKSHQHIIDSLDAAITRNLGSLRLPLNSKKPIEIDGRSVKYPLKFDDPAHRFHDGLVLLHDDTGYISRRSIHLTPSELQEEYQKKYTIHIDKVVYHDQQLDDESEDEISQCFYNIDKKFHTGLTPAGVSGSFLQLRRVYPGMCPISRRTHDSDGAYMFKKGPCIMFGCHRGCSISIGGKEFKSINVTMMAKQKWQEVADQLHAELPSDDI